MTPFLERLRGPLGAEGLNHVGVVARARFDAAVPESLRCARLHEPTRSIIVIGSGGGLHWERMLAYVAEDPVARLARTSHPLDDFGKAVLRRLGPGLEGCRVLHPHTDAPVHLDFMKLAVLAGLGRESELGILVSTRYGPWLGLRAAIFAPLELSPTEVDAESCPGCPAPCRTACHGDVVGPWPFPWDRCVTFRQQPESPCRSSCHARERCVVSSESTYPEIERLYHYDRAAGRAELCRMFGVTDEVGV